MQMDYEDEAFKSTWRKGILRIQIRNVKENTFNLMRIIFEAAVEHDKFNLAIDARELHTGLQTRSECRGAATFNGRHLY